MRLESDRNDANRASGCRRIRRNGTFRAPQRLKNRGFSAPRQGTLRFQWVGFGRRFGVKLGVLWAVESSLPLISDGSKHFKSLRKLTGKGEATNVMHITWFDPECIWAFKSGIGPAEMAPGV